MFCLNFNLSPNFLEIWDSIKDGILYGLIFSQSVSHRQIHLEHWVKLPEVYLSPNETVYEIMWVSPHKVEKFPLKIEVTLLFIITRILQMWTCVVFTPMQLNNSLTTKAATIGVMYLFFHLLDWEVTLVLH